MSRVILQSKVSGQPRRGKARLRGKGTTAPAGIRLAPDSAGAWLVDVLVPMSAMFRAAPILLTRGNHEACNRGGNGYYLFFDVHPRSSRACAPAAENGPVPQHMGRTRAIDLPISATRTLRLAVVDSAYRNDFVIDDCFTLPTRAHPGSGMKCASVTRSPNQDPRAGTGPLPTAGRQVPDLRNALWPAASSSASRALINLSARRPPEIPC